MKEDHRGKNDLLNGISCLPIFLRTISQRLAIILLPLSLPVIIAANSVTRACYKRVCAHPRDIQSLADDDNAA